MVIDTSAIVAILGNELKAETLRRAIVSDTVRLVPATCVFEARMVLVSRRGEHALAEIDLWLTKIAADVIASVGMAVCYALITIGWYISVLLV